MNDLEKNSSVEHDIQLLRVGQHFSTSKETIIEKFGDAPEDFQWLENNYWSDVKPLIDWILNNTQYKLVGVAKDNTYTDFYFVK